MTAHPSKQNGFTLVELMVTIVVLAILLAIAVPSFRDLIRRSEVSSASNALLADISYARTEAINRGSIASICPSTDGATCLSGSKTYESGWLVYTYAPGAAVASSVYNSAKPTENILLRATGAQKTVSIQAASNKVMSFGPQGQSQPDGTTYTFQTCFRQAGASGNGSSTKQVPGSQLDVMASGGVSSKSLGELSDCTPT